MVGAEGRPEALMAQRAELLPLWTTGVSLKDEVPLLGNPGEVIRCKPDSVGVARLVPIEKLFTLVQPPQRVLLAIKGGKRKLVVLGDDVTIRCRGHADMW